MRNQIRTFRSQSYALKENKENVDSNFIRNVSKQSKQSILRQEPLKDKVFRPTIDLVPKLNLHELPSKIVEPRRLREDSLIEPTRESLNSYRIQKRIVPRLLKHISETTEVESPEMHHAQLKKYYTIQIARQYGENIQKTMIQTIYDVSGMLTKHAITASLRAKMVDWMIEVLSSYKMSESSFFRSVKLMDRYLRQIELRQQVTDLHLIGVAAMFAATKYQDIHPLKLGVLQDKIARKKFTKTQILQKQTEILQSINFQIEETTAYDIASHFQTTLELGLSATVQEYLGKIVLYLSKMVYFCSELASQQSILLGAACLYVALKTLEQSHSYINPEEHLNTLLSSLGLRNEAVLDLSRKVLDLAKNFNRDYPTLTNLKRFNSFS